MVLVDPNGPASGSSGSIVGALSPHVPERWEPKKQFQLESLLMAQSFWSNVTEQGGLSTGYMRTGRLQPIATQNVLALSHTRTENAKELWQGQAQWSVIPVDPDNPWEPHSPTGMLIHDNLSAHMHPRMACAALVAALRSKGVEVQPDAPDQGKVIWAAGVQGLAELSRDYEQEFAERIFDQIMGFGEYGFPESHAASFAHLVYASGWIKRHHPGVFGCALLNSQPMGFYAPAQIVRDMREHGIDMITLGQYLQPSRDHLPVVRFVPPEEFDEYGDYADKLGFKSVASGPMVRSSYHADKQVDSSLLQS